MRALILLPLLALTGCVSDAARLDVARSAATSYNAAAAFPSPAAAAIEANQIAISAAMGYPLVLKNGSAVDPAGVKP